MIHSNGKLIGIRVLLHFIFMALFYDLIRLHIVQAQLSNRTVIRMQQSIKNALNVQIY